MKYMYPQRTSFLPRTACHRGTPGTSPTRTKLAGNLWNTFERLRATWISVEPRSLLVTRHDPSTFRKIGSKNATNFWNCSKCLKKFGGRKNFIEVLEVYLRKLLVFSHTEKISLRTSLNEIFSTSKFFLGSRAVPKIGSIFTTNFSKR